MAVVRHYGRRRGEMADKRATVEITQGGYLECLAHGARSGYVRAAVDARLEEVRQALRILRLARGEGEVVDLIDAASLPIAKLADTDIPSLSPVEGDCLRTLWAECELTGLEPQSLLAALESGVGA